MFIQLYWKAEINSKILLWAGNLVNTVKYRNWSFVSLYKAFMFICMHACIKTYASNIFSFYPSNKHSHYLSELSLGRKIMFDFSGSGFPNWCDCLAVTVSWKGPDRSNHRKKKNSPSNSNHYHPPLLPCIDISVWISSEKIILHNLLSVLQNLIAHCSITQTSLPFVQNCGLQNYWVSVSNVIPLIFYRTMKQSPSKH